jgi:putative glutamine amidotransferase
MSLHIAIPEPTSSDTEYNQRSLPPLSCRTPLGRVLLAIVVPLHERQDRVAQAASWVFRASCFRAAASMLNPQRFGEDPIPECGEADPARTAVDELLLQDAFNLQKPILAICHGALNRSMSGATALSFRTSRPR